MSSEMDLPASDGPDASSIKPVSSLLARFENLKQPSNGQLPSPARPISPAPKPDRLRAFKPSHGLAAAPPVASTPPPAKPPPPGTSKPPSSSMPTPTVMVQPPLSPLKGLPPPQSSQFRSPFLDPAAVVDDDDPAGQAIANKLPTRPRTPVAILHSAPRSPKPGSSRPPSPPPPRRSSEIRRVGDSKPPQPPPPASRSDRPISALPLPENQPMRVAGTVISQETSPFNSPPDSPGRAVPTAADDEPPPPELPARPKPRARLDSTGKPRLDLAGFEPPPVHHSVAVKRRERDQVANGAPGSINPIPQRPGLDCRGLPSYPPGPIELARQAPSLDARKPATRPPRPAPQTAPLHPRPDATSTPQPSSLAVRREGLAPTRRQPPPSSDEVASTGPDVAPAMPETISQTAVFPDGTRTNRRPPVIKKGCTEILTRYEPRILDVCGEIICTSGQLTRVWNIIDGEQIMSLSHTEGSRATSAAFKPAISADEEGAILWLGTNLGDIIEVELATQRILLSRGGVHARFEVSRIHRCRGELWTLDEGGTLLVWSPDADGSLNLAGQPSQTLKLPRGHTFSMVVERTLWHAAGKSIRIFAPTADGNNASFQVLVRPLTADGAGDISSGAQIRSQPGKVFLGHVDGKISIFSTTNYSCLAVLSINSWKINALAGVGQYLWAGYNSGKMCVYDTSQSPWRLKKEWQAHEQSILKMRADAASSFRLDRLQVVSLGADGKVKAWDGLLQEDWLEEEMKSKDEDYCGFEEIRALVMTWNAGATTPNSLRYSDGDAGFFRDLVQSSGWPEMFVFGFQELVDLEDKTATAKRFLKSKKKEGTDQERMSHQYRDWRDFLQQTLDDYMPAGDLYHLLHSAPLVGLFTCVFVKSSLRERIRGLSVAEVKRGMGGLHGNKGAVAVRFQVDETSVCFVNCHLAAGQSQANSRHNDIAAILEAGVFPAERDPEVRMDSFTGGGDGAMILDHEICVLNGDLNYRIDTMSRDTVVKAIRQQQLPKLLERDQLLVARRRNPTFRLRVFDEMPITFAPTYKYDVGSDNYDTSEKKRSPAWCDRLLFRGQGRVQQLDYRRHEVRVSDHRPVTGHFRLWVKKVDPRGRAVAWMKSQQGFEDLRQRETAEEKILYLMETCGYDEASSRSMVRGKGSTRTA